MNLPYGIKKAVKVV